MTAVLLAALLVLVAAKPHRPGREAMPIHSIRDTGGGQQYLVGNLVAGPIEVRCSLVSAGNVRSVLTLPRKLVLPALAERPVAQLHVARSLYSRGNQG